MRECHLYCRLGVQSKKASRPLSFLILAISGASTSSAKAVQNRGDSDQGSVLPETPSPAGRLPDLVEVAYVEMEDLVANHQHYEQIYRAGGPLRHGVQLARTLFLIVSAQPP